MFGEDIEGALFVADSIAVKEVAGGCLDCALACIRKAARDHLITKDRIDKTPKNEST